MARTDDDALRIMFFSEEFNDLCIIGLFGILRVTRPPVFERLVELFDPEDELGSEPRDDMCGLSNRRMEEIEASIRFYENVTSSEIEMESALLAARSSGKEGEELEELEERLGIRMSRALLRELRCIACQFVHLGKGIMLQLMQHNPRAPKILLYVFLFYTLR
jgi:hypothetical protein